VVHFEVIRDTHRAPTEQGRSDIEFDGAVFVHVTPPEPEIEAEP
jgi:hypothetical protein